MNLLREHIYLFDGIAIDIRLAELNGYEFIRFVKAENIDRDRAVCGK
jgi:CheY-like chemotaxis protein